MRSSSFFTAFFGSCLGIASFFIVGIFILFLMGLSGAISGGKSYSKKSILHLDFGAPIPEKSENIAQGSVFDGPSPTAIGLQRMLDLIAYAADDKKIDGIVIENPSFLGGQATALALMEGLKSFKEKGKFIYAYADTYGQTPYFLCSAADSIFLNPFGMVDMRGYGTAIPFVKNMLDKIGVKMEVFYAGNFKSATEPFRLTEMSDYNEAQTRAFLHDMFDLFEQKVLANRPNMTDLDSVLNKFLGREATSALAHGLVDSLCYKQDFENFIRKKQGLSDGKKIKYVSIEAYNTMADLEYPDADDRIAVIHAEGEIVYNQNEPGSISEKRYIKALDRVLNDETVKGVVLRVNSPGGDAFTSEVIYQAINKIKAKGIPVVASFGDYAASGGYYIACNADKIYSQPNTLTGSIGVFSMFPDATGLLNDKIGINFDTIKTHNYSVGFSPVLPLTDEEAMLLQASTDDMYQKFTQRVAEGRKLSMDSVKVIAQGRVWTGKAAQSIGLVDEMGGLSEAIAYTAAQANIDNFELIHYPSVKKDFLSTLLSEIQKGQDMDEDSRSMIKLSQEQKNLLGWYKASKAILNTKGPQARLPFILTEQ